MRLEKMTYQFQRTKPHASVTILTMCLVTFLFSIQVAKAKSLSQYKVTARNTARSLLDGNQNFSLFSIQVFRKYGNWSKNINREYLQSTAAYETEKKGLEEVVPSALIQNLTAQSDLRNVLVLDKDLQMKKGLSSVLQFKPASFQPKYFKHSPKYHRRRHAMGYGTESSKGKIWCRPCKGNDQDERINNRNHKSNNMYHNHKKIVRKRHLKNFDNVTENKQPKMGDSLRRPIHFVRQTYIDPIPSIPYHNIIYHHQKRVHKRNLKKIDNVTENRQSNLNDSLGNMKSHGVHSLRYSQSNMDASHSPNTNNLNYQYQKPIQKRHLKNFENVTENRQSKMGNSSGKRQIHGVHQHLFHQYYMDPNFPKPNHNTYHHQKSVHKRNLNFDYVKENRQSKMDDSLGEGPFYDVYYIQESLHKRNLNFDYVTGNRQSKMEESLGERPINGVHNYQRSPDHIELIDDSNRHSEKGTERHSTGIFNLNRRRRLDVDGKTIKHEKDSCKKGDKDPFCLGKQHKSDHKRASATQASTKSFEEAKRSRKSSTLPTFSSPPSSSSTGSSTSFSSSSSSFSSSSSSSSTGSSTTSSSSSSLYSSSSSSYSSSPPSELYSSSSSSPLPPTSSQCYFYAVNASHVGSFGCDSDYLFNYTSSSPSAPELSPSTLTVTEWTRIVSFSLIFVVGVVGNVLVVVTLLHHRNMRTVTNVFLLNLAVSDLLLGVFCMPFTLVGSLLQDFVFGSLMCRLIPYIQAVSVSVSVWTLVAISLERYYAICQPLRSRRWQTPSHSYRVIAVVWVASLLFMMPIAVLSTLMPVKGDQGRHKCREVWPSLDIERTFTIILTMTLLLVPLMVMVAAYIRVVRALWLGATVERCSSSIRSQNPQIQVSTVEDESCERKFSLHRKLSSPMRKISMRFRKVPSSKRREGEPNDKYGDVPNSETTHSSDDKPSVEAVNTESSSQDPAGHQNHSLNEGCRSSKRRRWRRSRKNSSPTSTSSAVRKESWRTLIRTSQPERSLIAKRRVVRMLFVLVVEFFICWSPLFLVNLLSLYIPRQVYAALGSVGVSLVQLLAYISSCCNPITYCFMNAKFLQSFKQTFGCAHNRSEPYFSTNYSHSFRGGGADNHNSVPLNVMVDRGSIHGTGSRRQNSVHRLAHTTV